VPIATTIRDVDFSRNIDVIDFAATLAVDSEIPADLVHVNAAGAIVLYDHRTADVGGVNTARAI